MCIQVQYICTYFTEDCVYYVANVGQYLDYQDYSRQHSRSVS